MMRLAGLVLVCAGLAAPVQTRAQTAELTLQCPETVAGFSLQGRDGGVCDYRAASGAQAIVRRAASARAAPAGVATPRLDIAAPAPFEGDVYHLGEGETGDRRLALWRAGPDAAMLEIEARYVIPRTARGEISGFAVALAEANGLTGGAETGTGVDCPAPPGGFRVAERLTGEQAGAAVRWSCAYLQGDIFAFFYAPRDPALVLPSFEEQLSDDAREAGPSPGLPAADRLVRDKGVYRGLWSAGDGEQARAVEVDWVTEEERDAVAALLRALLG